MDESIRARIFDVADRLLAEGKKPTQQAVREALGSGSLTTINKGLNAWWGVLGTRLDEYQKGQDIPEPVIRLSSRLWNEALAYAERTQLARDQSSAQQISSLKDELSTQKQNHDRQITEYQNKLSRQYEQLDSLAIRLAQKTEELAEVNEQCFRLTRECEQLRSGNSGPVSEQLTEARVRLQLQEEELERLRAQNSELRSENAELKMRVDKG